MKRSFLRSSLRGFELVTYDVPKWVPVVEKVLDATLAGAWCCKINSYRITRLLHAPMNALPEGKEVEVVPLTPEHAYYVTKALDLDVEFTWAMTVSIMAEELEEKGRLGDALALYGLLSRYGYDRMGEPSRA